MIVLNTRAVERAAAKYRDAAGWLETWSAVARAATWQSIEDVRRDFASADGVPLRGGVVVTVFNVKGNEYRLLTTINYRQQQVYVLEVMTHAKYSRQRQWKRRYE